MKTKKKATMRKKKKKKRRKTHTTKSNDRQNSKKKNKSDTILQTPEKSGQKSPDLATRPFHGRSEEKVANPNAEAFIEQLCDSVALGHILTSSRFLVRDPILSHPYTLQQNQRPGFIAFKI